MNRSLLAAATVAGLVLSLPAAAQFQKPEDAIKYRQSAFTVLAGSIGRLGAMAQGRVPYDQKVAVDQALIANVVAPLPFTAFGDGTDKGLPNRAKPEIWKDQAKFKAAAEKMLAEVAKLDAAAKAGNVDALRGAMGGVGAACKACHDDYRAEKYSAN